MEKISHRAGFVALGLIGIVALVAALGFSVFAFQNLKPGTSIKAQEEIKVAVFSPSGDEDIVNEDGNQFTSGAGAWIGTGQNVSQSYFALLLTGDALPQGATIKKAELKFVEPQEEWIGVSFKAQVEDSASPQKFSSSSRPSSRVLLSATDSYSSNDKWKAGETYAIDVTSSFSAFAGKYGGNKLAMILKGAGSAWGRKFIYKGNGQKPRLEVKYTVSASSQISTPTLTSSPTVKPTTSASATPVPSPTVTIKPINSPTPGVISPTIAPTASASASGGTIVGLVTADILGTCPAAVHDRYVVTGPDGKTYRTWHPIAVPLDANNPNGAKCSFAHEHGDNPATSVVDKSMPPFDYIASQLVPPMDEPHVGFKVFVVNAGDTDTVGATSLHSYRLVFHMGTGGPARFTTRFHSEEYKILTKDGKKMFLQGMADTGGVNDICSNRIGKTVEAFGCKIDSGYEIWEDKLSITNKGNVVATAISSPALFDPITIMDPNDKTKVIYAWDPAASAIYKFPEQLTDAARNRGCRRHSYHGPIYWYNANGSEVYYTDAYGNVVTGGPLKQEISRFSSDFGPATSGLGFIATYLSGNAPNTQYQSNSDANNCAASLGIKN